MTNIINQEFAGERPLYHRSELSLSKVTIHPGESSLKECSRIQASDCRFEGKYLLWCCDDFSLRDCTIAESARSSIWHSSKCSIERSLIEAPKLFRECSGISLSEIRFTAAQETLWFCNDVTASYISAEQADYIFLQCSNARIDHFTLSGNYAFQRARNIEIHDSNLQTKDSFWESEDVCVYDSTINGEYLGWHSKNLRLVRCHIGGTQPLCYAENLILEDCTFDPDACLAFEYSSVRASIRGHITSIKNPRSGSISADSCGEIILDDNIKQPADCIIAIGPKAQ